MSRSTLLRCALLGIALFGTALTVAWVERASAAFTTPPSLSLSLDSSTLLAWPLVHVLLSP